MLKKIIYFCLSILLIFTFSIKITSYTTNIKNLPIIKNHKDLLYNINTNKNNTDILGTITINKINLKNNLYNINDTRNNIEENVTILKESVMPDKDNSIIFLAAHSGTGRIAYFERLNELKINDIIKLKLKNKTYKHGGYTTFYISEPKVRKIEKSRYIDRIVHRWIVDNFLEPYFVPTFINSTFACLKNRGMHRAAQYVQNCMRKAKTNWDNYYILKMDIAKYFDNINKKILFNILERKIQDEKLMWLLTKILYSQKREKGLEIRL